VNKIIRNKFKGIDVLVNNAGIGPDLGKGSQI
jgi:NAD(P)-dependent dehydrogenase (short-subunit alcohol dehydrogenase family)